MRLSGAKGSAAALTLAVALTCTTAAAQQRKPAHPAPIQQHPAPAQDELTIAVGGAFTSLDPQYHNFGPNNALTGYVFEPLIRFDATFHLEPALAVSWQALDEKTWEIRLRRDVTFQDGAPFTADDVVFSLSRIPTLLLSPGSFEFAIRPIVQTEVTDPYTLRLHTDAPVPLMPYNLTYVDIIARGHAEGMTTSSFNSLQSAIGTGPYRVTAFTAGEQATLQRNGSWWDKPPHWTTVRYRVIADDAARIAALRSGQADIIDRVPTADAAALQASPNLSVVSVPSQQLIYLAPDASRTITPFATDQAGRPMETNPLRDPRVRRALSLAIDRQALKDKIMNGYAAPTGQLMPEGVSGFDAAIPVDPYDPEHAKKLLADAGYPLGFGLTLHGPVNRYVNDVKLADAIALMWTDVGVKTKVETLPVATFYDRALHGEFTIRLTGWESDTGEASSDLIALIASSDPDKGRDMVLMPDKYANPKVDTIIEQALATIDQDKRESLYREAVRLAMPDMPIIPLQHQVNIWALRKGLAFHAPMRDRTDAWDIEPR